MMLKKNKLFVILAIALGTVLFTFQNCSNQKMDHNGVTTLVPNAVNAITAQVTTLQWRYTSGSLPPIYQYDITYRVDVLAKQLIVAVTGGSGTTGLPLPKTLFLTDAQLSQILFLFDKMTYAACGTKATIAGGGIDELSVFVGNAVSASALIYATTCPYEFTGSNGFVNTFGYQNLTNYLKSL
ncbi:MAG: hypothetical protein H7256_04440 [Bdellovibrio sp.]|nr:hypothetical protein [Bdellovibrio sp.]